LNPKEVNSFTLKLLLFY